MKRRYYFFTFLLGVITLSAYLFIYHLVPEVKWSKPVRLTQDVSDELSPVLSPNGKRIAFTKRYYKVTGTYHEIVMMDLETKETVVTFSPSDVKKICETDEIKNFSTTEVHRLSWNKNKIIFNTYCNFYIPNQVKVNLTDETCAPKLPPEAQIPGLGFGEDKIIKMVIINDDGSNPQVIKAGEHPDFDPDGKKIVYLFKSGFRVSACQICGKEIHELDLVTQEDRLIYKQNNTLFRPTYSPSGKLIVFERREDPAEKKRNDIYLVSVDGKTLKRLTYGYDNTYPIFSPDGKRIIFISNMDGDDELYSLDLESGRLEKLTEMNAIEACCPTISRDGNKIIFSALREGYDKGFDLWMIERK